MDSRSDQFSYCAALYEALYGRHPFASDTLEGLRGRVMFGKVSPPPRDSAVPSVIHQALLRGLAPDPAQRFPSMRELLAALDVDPDRDAALDRRSSRRIGALIGLGFFSFIGGFYYLLLTYGVTYRLFVGSMVTVFASGIFGGVVVRRTLAQYTFHRGLYVSLMLGIALNLSMALIGTRMGVPLAYLGIASMMNIGCTYGFMAYHYLPLLWACCAIACGSGLVLGILSAPAAWVLATGQVVYPLTTLGLAWIWFRAARKRQGSCEP